MQRINLIPKSRRHARQRRVRTRFWIVALLIYTVAFAGACMVYRGTATRHNLPALSAELAEHQAELARLADTQNSLRPELDEKRLILAAGRSISDQPDWSRLLTYLADHVLGEQVVLSGCSLAPHTPDAAKTTTGGADANDATSLVLKLSGYARTTPDVSQFILRLEGIGLFDQVKLVRTNLEPYLNDQAIAFEAHCLMYNGGGSHE